MKCVILIVWITLCALQSANACSCAEPPAVSKALTNADLVVYGRCQSFTVISDSHRVAKIQIKTVFKGKVKESELIDIGTSIDGASCGFSFIAGESYLIYGYADKDKFRTNICTRTKLLPPGIYLKTDQEYKALEMMKVSEPGKWTTYDLIQDDDPFRKK